MRYQTKSFADRSFSLSVLVVSVVAFFITLYPFVYILSVSFSNPVAIDRGEVFLWPVGFSLVGYKQVLRQSGLWQAYGNTIFYTVVGTVLNLVSTCLAAYPLSRRTFCARRPLNFLIVFVMYFSGGLIPSYLLMTQMGFYNSRWVMIIPSLLSSYNVMVCRSAFIAIPEEIMESANIDGANDWQIVYRIGIRLITPTLAVLALYYAVAHWNDFFTALLYFSRENLMPMQVLLRRVLIQSSQEFMRGAEINRDELTIVSTQIRYVTIVVATVPILTIYPFLQKYFVKGVMLGAVKA